MCHIKGGYMLFFKGLMSSLGTNARRRAGDDSREYSLHLGVTLAEHTSYHFVP
jgi:hypothetical protein